MSLEPRTSRHRIGTNHFLKYNYLSRYIIVNYLYKSINQSMLNTWLFLEFYQTRSCMNDGLLICLISVFIVLANNQLLRVSHTKFQYLTMLLQEGNSNHLSKTDTLVASQCSWSVHEEGEGKVDGKRFFSSWKWVVTLKMMTWVKGGKRI